MKDLLGNTIKLGDRVLLSQMDNETLDIARVNCFCRDKRFDSWIDYLRCSSDGVEYNRECKDVVDLTALYRKYKAPIPSEQERWLNGDD